MLTVKAEKPFQSCNTKKKEPLVYLFNWLRKRKAKAISEKTWFFNLKVKQIPSPEEGFFLIESLHGGLWIILNNVAQYSNLMSNYTWMFGKL